PFGPTRPTFSPRLIAAEASMKRIWRPCCLPMLSSRITYVGLAARGGGGGEVGPHIASRPAGKSQSAAQSPPWPAVKRPRPRLVIAGAARAGLRAPQRHRLGDGAEEA